MKRIIMTLLCIVMLACIATSCYTAHKCPAYGYTPEAETDTELVSQTINN
ncbi:MAG: hypothetical protein FWC10_03230 [Lentimicrobiaceae bacterium]|nr:hypothetical protein [Lentimicrobiaceae bacterium]